MSDKRPLTKREAALRTRKLHILDAALACFAERGFHQSGMRDIAKYAKVSLGNLYNHFPSKHDMLVGMAELEARELSRFVDMLLSEEPVQKGLSTFLREYGIYMSNRTTAALNLEIFAEAMRQQEVADLFLKARIEMTDALVSLLKRGVGEGIFHTDAASTNTACFILDLIESTSFRVLVDFSDIEEIFQELETFISAAVQSTHRPVP